MLTRINQSRIIPKLNQFIRIQYKNRPVPYEVNQTGICSGLSCRYLLKKLKGEERSFFSDLGLASKIGSKDYAKQEGFLTKFISSNHVAHRPNSFISKAEQGDIDLFKGDFEGEFQRSHGAFGNVKLENLSKFLDPVLSKEDSYHYIASGNHAIAICKKDNKFFFYDSNDEEGEREFDSIDKVSDAIKSALTNSDDTHIDIKIKSFVPSGKKTSSIELKHIRTYHDTVTTSDGVDPTETTNAELLVRAVRNNDIEIVKQLLDENVDPTKALASFSSSPDGEKKSALEVACIYGYSDTIMMMLNKCRQKPGGDHFNALKSALPWTLTNRDLKTGAMLTRLFLDEYTDKIDSEIAHDLYLYTILGGKNVDAWKELEAKFSLKDLKIQAIEKQDMLDLALTKGAVIFAEKIVEAFDLKNVRDWINKSLSEKQEQSLKWSFAKAKKLIISFDDSDMKSFLELAIETGKPQLVKMVLDNFPKYKVTYLDCRKALSKGDMPVVMLLLNSKNVDKKDENIQTLRSIIELSKWRPITKARLLRKLEGQSPEVILDLFKAAVTRQDMGEAEKYYAKIKNTEECKSFIKAELVNAATVYDLTQMQNLIEKFGGDVNTTSDNTHPNKALKDKSLIQIAYSLHNTDMINYLLDKEAKLTPDEQTKLFSFACRYGEHEIAKTLIEKYGFNPDVSVKINNQEISFLSIALRSKYRSAEVVQLIYDQIEEIKLEEDDSIKLIYALLERACCSKDSDAGIQIAKNLIEQNGFKKEDKKMAAQALNNLKRAVVTANPRFISEILTNDHCKLGITYDDINKCTDLANRKLEGKDRENVIQNLMATKDSRTLLLLVQTILTNEDNLQTSKFGSKFSRNYTYKSANKKDAAKEIKLTSTARNILNILQDAIEEEKASREQRGNGDKEDIANIWDKALAKVYEELDDSIESYIPFFSSITLFGTTPKSYETYQQCKNILTHRFDRLNKEEGVKHQVNNA